MKRLTVLGSTGSIGTQALEVAEKTNWQITALAAGRNVRLAETQARKFKPQFVAMFDKDAAAELKIKLADTDIKVCSGEAGVIAAAESDCDTVLNSIVGIAGLKSTLAAINKGTTVALANKETLVTGGEIVNRRLKETGVRLLPVDSEHSAIFQSLQGAPENSLKKILLTASGGPFYGKKRKDLESVTVKDALNHPNWSMGAKITVDSASLMNKGLEVIEAVHLFGVTADKIEVLVHRQSILHSAVELCDGAVIAQLGTPDMRLPIQLALTWPERVPCKVPRMSLAEVAKLTFFAPDYEAFPALNLAKQAAALKGDRGAVLNGANEAAVGLFLDGRIGFTEIAERVSHALDSIPYRKDITLDDVLAADRAARELVLG